MGKKSKKKVKSQASEPSASGPPQATSSCASSNIKPDITIGGKPQLDPGRKATLRNLVSRKDLNGMEVTVGKELENGRIAVELVMYRDTKDESKEVLAVKRENLQLNSIGDLPAGSDMKHWGKDEEECPICMDPLKNPGCLECCGKYLCEKCYVQMQYTQQRGTCPLCRADISDRSEPTVIKRVRTRAERGDANAMYNLGVFYDEGRTGLAQDQAVARVWLKRAAEAGESRGAYNLGCMYRDGEGGPTDKALAAKYFRMAGDMGHVQGMTNYGLALFLGDGVQRNPDEGKKWLQKAADAGDNLAAQQLEMFQMMASMNALGVKTSCRFK